MRRILLILSVCAASVPALVAQPVEKVNWTTGVPYTYDGTGNVTAVGSDKYVYDDVGRLVQAEVNAVKRNYTYDAFGNRKTCTQADPAADCQYTFSINPANNRIAEATYDKGIPNGPGNVTTFLQHGYSYDALNVMTSDNALQFIYTADDERIATYVSGAGGGGWRWTIRDAANKVLREFTSRNGSAGFGKDGWAWGRDYVWRESVLLASRQPENNATTTYHYHVDHLGTPRQITDDKDLTVGFHDYFAFGPETNNGKTEPSPASLKYTGHERDGQDAPYSLDYMHARYYNNSLGRFLSVDPKWESSDPRKPQTLNRYSYAQNNPLTRIDPDGRRDVYVAVWNAKYPYVAGRGSVGHAAMFEMSGKTIVSQFPEPHGTHGKNETLTYGQTVIKENGRLPDKVFRVTLPNDAELDAARNAQRATKWWDADPDPDDNETHCSAAVYSLLKAGGANILLIGFGAPLPSDVQDILAQVARKQKGSPYPTVREVPRDTIQSTPDRFKK